MAILLMRTAVIPLTNKSGGSVAQGDVVSIDAANAGAFTTTTTGGFINGLVGVVLSNAIANNATGLVAVGGYVSKINLSSSASLGDVFKTHTVAKQAVRHALPMVAGDFGIVLATGTTPAAFLFNLTNQAPSSAHVIQDESTPLTARGNLNFVGGDVDASDDAGNNATLVKIYKDTPPEDIRFFYPLTVVAGNTPSTEIGSKIFNLLQSTGGANANGDAFSIEFYLNAGTYTFNVLGETYPSSGKIDWTVDGGSILAGHDFYSASGAQGVLKSQAGIVILTSGLHTLQGTINGKNASSSGYQYNLTAFWFS